MDILYIHVYIHRVLEGWLDICKCIFLMHNHNTVHISITVHFSVMCIIQYIHANTHSGCSTIVFLSIVGNVLLLGLCIVFS